MGSGGKEYNRRAVPATPRRHQAYPLFTAEEQKGEAEEQEEEQEECVPWHVFPWPPAQHFSSLNLGLLG